MKNTLSRSIVSLITASSLFICGAALGQQPSLLSFKYPELANYFNAFDVVNAAILEEVVITNESSSSAIGKDLLRENLEELAEADASHYHSSGDHLAMLGPYRVFESRATPSLISMLRDEHSNEAADVALANSETLPEHALVVLKRGQAFEETLMDIYLDGNIMDKKTAVDQAIAEYLSDDQHSLPTQPKSSDLLSEHDHAYAFRVGFPQLSGLTWAAQWLRLAAYEVLITTFDENETAAGIDKAMELYVEKIARLHGSMVSLPSDIPTIPVIAPTLYSAHPKAAVIIDNLSVLKIVLGDILAHPDLIDRETAINTMISAYTDKESDLVDEVEYLTFVLRGGIFNQGGPARGGLVQSERNQSRDSLENPHISNFPMPL